MQGVEKRQFCSAIEPYKLIEHVFFNVQAHFGVTKAQTYMHPMTVILLSKYMNKEAVIELLHISENDFNRAHGDGYTLRKTDKHHREAYEILLSGLIREVSIKQLQKTGYW